MKRITLAFSFGVLVFFFGIQAQAQIPPYVINTLAGGGPNNWPALLSAIGFPNSVAGDPAGNLYFSDEFTNRVFRVDSSGTLTVVAGTGIRGYSGDGGPATQAELNYPSGVFVDANGNIFIADTNNGVIREVVAATGIIQTVAGNGPGSPHPCQNAELCRPGSVFVDANGNIFIADTLNEVIREVVAATGTMVVVAGSNGAQGYSGDGGPATNAELFSPVGVFVDSKGNIFIADTSNNRIREVLAATGIIQTVAGNGTAGYSGDGGLATQAELNFPTSVFVDTRGNIFIADMLNNRIREVLAVTGIIQTVAGNGTAGYYGDGGLATQAELYHPSGVFVDANGNIFIADTGNWRIREVVAATEDIQTVAGGTLFGDGDPATQGVLLYPSGVTVDGAGDIFIADAFGQMVQEVVAATGIFQAVAGSKNGTLGHSGDGGPATQAELNYPFGVFVDANGNIFIADSGNSAIREVVAATGIIQTVAGNGSWGYSGDGGPATKAELNGPAGVSVDTRGNIFIADTGNLRIREVAAATGIIQTVAGGGTNGLGDGGPATQAQLGSPTGVFVDTRGNIFIASDSLNRIREVVAATGIIQTVAGNGTGGYSGDGGPATNAELFIPVGVFVDSKGDIFIADSGNNVIREVVAATGIIQTVAGNGTGGYSGDGGPARDAELNGPYGVALDAAGHVLIADTQNMRIRELTLPPGLNATTITLSITATPSSSQSDVGSNVTWTATVAHTTGTAAPTGTISFWGNSTILETTALNSNGVATYSTSDLTVDQYSIRAVYNGDSNYEPSFSAAALLNVVDFEIAANPTTITITTPGQSGTTTLTITPLGGFNQALSFKCSGLPSVANCSFADTSGGATMTITTTAAGAPSYEMPFGRGKPLSYVLLVPGFLALVFAGTRKHALRGMRLLCLLCAVGFCSVGMGCGGGTSSSPVSSPVPSGGTPIGTSTITVTAAVGLLSHQTTVTLVVR